MSVKNVNIHYLARLCTKISLTLASCLPFVAFLDAGRNIDMQGLLLILAGAFAWAGIILGKYWPLDRKITFLIAAFVLAGILSLAINPNKVYGLIGAPFLRLGWAGLVSCIGIALLIARLHLKKLSVHIYTGILLLSLISVLSEPLASGDLRFGGLFDQASVLACTLGCAILLGWEIMRLYDRYKNYILGSQAFLLVLLVWTGTRAVLGVVLALSFVWMYQNLPRKRFAMYLLLTAGLLLGFAALAPGRLTDRAYAKESLDYRLSLQNQAFEISLQKPLLGFGPGNLADALECRDLAEPELLKTCEKGYFFNSSHNIFLDRVLMVGWPGGLAYLSLIILAVYKTLRSRELKIAGLIIILISLYYLTNVTHIVIELLLWVFLMQALAYKSSRASTSQ
jgi:O-antigen ligase